VGLRLQRLASRADFRSNNATMIHTFSCPSCQYRFKGKVPTNAKRVRCPKCQSILDVPQAEVFVGEVVEPVVPVGEIVEQDVLVGEVVEDQVLVGEVVETAPVARPAAPARDASPDFGSPRLPRSDVLRPLEYHVFATSQGHTMWYDVRDADGGETLGELREIVSGGKRAALVGNVKRGQMAGHFELIDADSEDCLLRVRRSAFKAVVALQPCEVKLLGPDDRRLASFEAGKLVWNGTAVDWDTDCWIRDAAGRKWACLAGKKMIRPDFEIHDRADKVLAEVRARSTRKRVFGASTGGTLEVTFRERLARDPVAKLVLLGSIAVYESIMDLVVFGN
jgi:hypothetical protein